MTDPQPEHTARRTRAAVGGPTSPSAPASGGRDHLDEVAAADAAVARFSRRVTRPARRLVNAPHLLVGAIVVVWVACSGLYSILEGKGPIEGLWWGVVTGSTVGYGDFYPATTAGRGVAVFLIVAMLVLVPIAIGHVIANLVLDRNQFTHDEQVALATTIEDLHDRVGRIEHLVLAGLARQHGPDWVAEQAAAYAEHETASEDHDDRMLELFVKDDE